MAVVVNPYCQSCGNDPEHGAELTLTVRNNIAECLCSFCQGLIDAGMLRAEVVDGELRYRQWNFEWTKGDLLPSAAKRREDADRLRDRITTPGDPA